MASDVVQELGCRLDQARNAMDNAVRFGWLKNVRACAPHRPAVYVITAEGRERANFVPKAELRRRDAQIRIKARAESKSERMRAAAGPRRTKTTVEIAIRNTPNSVFALGAM
ncbi:MAG: hypothetical protein DI563_01995 [Variovorax paradoxus]|uniref:Uncharacterized protein n=1 Tax=Variovorax paradoxus TaxID=34073 RepID=A0A2W5QLW6_VARPD|nr:MAG: hypothetical protein DI563_01995 [Variovorax paradoxus]